MKSLALVLSFISMVSVIGCSSSPATPAPAPQTENLAPDFSLKNLDGQTVSLRSLRGKPVMLNFWASWCGPCRQEMPFIQGVFDDDEWARQGLVILAINVGESSTIAQKYIEDNRLSFTVLLDTDQNVAKNYNIRGIPTTFFIDKNGIIRDWKIGAFTNKTEIDLRLANSILEGKQEGS
ncbi:MAG: hypothetical protein A2144_00915 [Chloroflexi bacterium RBG_16_50_9]|nr:MAG: hypothetical protein A2144_00915 [Chloroflexi bacterium RBG_16_50_9]